jgi:dTDP-4-dehydrorhamnose reductase
MRAAPKRILVAGASGQLGRALVALLGPRVAWSGGSAELDARDGAAVTRRVAEVRPDLVVNASAYNKVDAAESDAREALAVNAAGPAHLARACREAGALLVHVSTDYVFDGASTRPYTEEDAPRPISYYGASKLAGEAMVTASGCEYLLVRTSGVFGAGGSRGKGGSFVDRILARARAGEPLRVVSDQVFSRRTGPGPRAPGLVDLGARGLFTSPTRGNAPGTALLAALRCRPVPVEEIRAADLGLPARRPARSVLSNARYASLGLPLLRPWLAALEEFLSA